MGKIWAVCSGSGGVGKTTVALSIAVGASKAGRKTIFLDASCTSRSSDLVLQMENVVVLDMLSVLHEQVDISSSLYPVPRYENLYFACASFSESITISEMSAIIVALHSMCDILVIDLPTGHVQLGRGIMQSGDERLFVLRPEDASIRTTELLLTRCQGESASSVLVINHLSRERIKHKTQYAKEVVQNLLDCPAIAAIPEDASIPECELNGRSAIECDGPAWSILSSLTNTLLGSV